MFCEICEERVEVPLLVEVQKESGNIFWLKICGVCCAKFHLIPKRV